MKNYNLRIIPESVYLYPYLINGRLPDEYQ